MKELKYVKKKKNVVTPNSICNKVKIVMFLVYK